MYNLDYSIRSLSELEDDVNDAADYFGEVVRKKYGGSWQCSLDFKNNSLHYGKPVIIGYTIPEDLELSPFDSVLIYIYNKTEKGSFFNNH